MGSGHWAFFVPGVLSFVAASCVTLTMLAAPWSNPPDDLTEADLVGTWVNRRLESVDTIVLREDGTFQQTYEWIGDPPYSFQTPWNKWSLERQPDGRVLLRLSGARYYPDGIDFAEAEGRDPYHPLSIFQPELYPDGYPRSFYDPFANAWLEMLGELVLNVRLLPGDQLILHHMWGTSDRGFALLDGEEEMFTRVADP